MDHLMCRAQVACVLHDGPKTHVTQQPNGMVLKTEEIYK